MPQQTLHDFVLILLSDHEALTAFKLDPQGALDKAGLADLTPQDVQEAIPLVMDYADSSLTASFIGGLDGAASEAFLATPYGDYATGVGVLANGDDGPAAVFGLNTPYGGVLTSVSSKGLDVAATGEFSALADLSDTLDADALGIDTTAVVADTLHACSDLTPGLTGTNGAASLLTAGASATVGLVGTGTDLTMGALTSPADTTAVVLDSVTSLNSGTSPMDLPVDVVQLPAAGIPVVDQAHSDDLIQDVVGQAPAGDLTDQLQAGLPLDMGHTLDTVDHVHDSVLGSVDDSAASDILQQTGTSDLVGGGPLSNVVGQSPVSDVISLSQQGGTTDLVSDVISLDDTLPF